MLNGRTIIVPADADPAAHLYAFDVESGELRWKQPFPQGVATTPLLRGDRLITLSVLGTLASLHPGTGEISWNVSPAGSLQAMPRLQSPAASGGRIFFGDNAQTLYAIDHSDGHTIWSKALGARLNTSLLVVGDEVLGGTVDGVLHHLALNSGEEKRTVKLNGIPYGTLIAAPPLVLVLVKSDEARLIALDPAKGRILWEQKTPGEWTTFRPLIAGTTVIVGDDRKELCGFALADGSRLWCMAIGEVPRGLGTSPDGQLYVGTLSGKVLALPGPPKTRVTTPKF